MTPGPARRRFSSPIRPPYQRQRFATSTKAALAGGTFLQVDQAAPSDQAVLWDVGERGEDANLDRGVGYVLVAIVRKRLKLEASLYTLMQVLSVAIFKKMQIESAFFADTYSSEDGIENNQLHLFNF
jgi:hypothetical protein